MKKIIIILIVLLAIIQLFSIEKNTGYKYSKNNIIKTVDVPENIENILRKSCYDCHSNNSTYPWYSRIQPVGWMMEHHINEGKSELNFDEFKTYSTKKQQRKLEEIWEEIEEGEMPMKPYLIMHENAKLSQEDKSLLKNWIEKLTVK